MRLPGLYQDPSLIWSVWNLVTSFEKYLPIRSLILLSGLEAVSLRLFLAIAWTVSWEPFSNYIIDCGFHKAGWNKFTVIVPLGVIDNKILVVGTVFVEVRNVCLKRFDLVKFFLYAASSRWSVRWKSRSSQCSMALTALRGHKFHFYTGQQILKSFPSFFIYFYQP